MTTKRILELTEADEPISPYAFGPNASIQRGRRSRPPLEHPGPTGPRADDEPSDADRMRRLRGKVI